jgi:hypothetical protein
MVANRGLNWQTGFTEEVVFKWMIFDSYQSKLLKLCKLKKTVKYTAKLVYKGHSREPENVSFVSRCPLYTG